MLSYDKSLSFGMRTNAKFKKDIGSFDVQPLLDLIIAYCPVIIKDKKRHVYKQINLTLFRTMFSFRYKVKVTDDHTREA